MSAVCSGAEMVQDVNKFGKRPADDDGEGGSPKRRSGLHKFAGSSPPALDIGAVHGRYQKFIQSAFALKGAMAFQDLLQDGSSPGVPAKERERCAVEFHRALAEALADTPSLDNDQQRFVIEMACNTEKVADAGKTINLACKHLDDFKETPRAMLLLNGIRAFADIQPDARTELFGHLSSAAGKGYLGETHLDALNTGRLGKPAEISVPLSVLAQELDQAAAARPVTRQSAPSRSWKTPKLDKLPPEILQNIILRAIEPDLRKDGPQGLAKALKTTEEIASTNKSLRANTNGLRLFDLRTASKEAMALASKRHGDFLKAAEELFAMESSENFNLHDQRYLQSLGHVDVTTRELFPVIKLLGEKEQSKMIETFCKFNRPEDVASLLAAASEHTENLYPKPRSEIYARLLQVLPLVS